MKKIIHRFAAGCRPVVLPFVLFALLALAAATGCTPVPDSDEPHDTGLPPSPGYLKVLTADGKEGFVLEEELEAEERKGADRADPVTVYDADGNAIGVFVISAADNDDANSRNYTDG